MISSSTKPKMVGAWKGVIGFGTKQKIKTRFQILMGLKKQDFRFYWAVKSLCSIYDRYARISRHRPVGHQNQKPVTVPSQPNVRSDLPNQHQQTVSKEDNKTTTTTTRTNVTQSNWPLRPANQQFLFLFLFLFLFQDQVSFISWRVSPSTSSAGPEKTGNMSCMYGMV